MAAIVRGLSRAFGTQIDVDTLKTVAVFCGAGLLLSLLLAMYGLDIGAGFGGLD